MIRGPLIIAAAIAAISAPLAAQGDIGTIMRGQYHCELPGDAAGASGIAQPDESFRILGASRYSAAEGSGTYLRRGDRIIMTSGPRKGDSYVMLSNGFLRKLEGGQPGRLRCIRTSR